MFHYPVNLMVQFHLLGAATGPGESFRRQAFSAFPDCSLYAYLREPNKIVVGAHRADFSKPEVFHPAGDLNTSSVSISFGPIWLLLPSLSSLSCVIPSVWSIYLG